MAQIIRNKENYSCFTFFLEEEEQMSAISHDILFTMASTMLGCQILVVVKEHLVNFLDFCQKSCQ